MMGIPIYSLLLLPFHGFPSMPIFSPFLRTIYLVSSFVYTSLTLLLLPQLISNDLSRISVRWWLQIKLSEQTGFHCFPHPLKNACAL